MRPPGDVAEWLGRGLQSLVQRFESARRLVTGIFRIFGILDKEVFAGGFPVRAESLDRGLSVRPRGAQVRLRDAG